MSALALRRVRTCAEANDDAVRVHLFRNGQRQVCGWFIGPLSLETGGISLPYLPRSKETRASVAVVRAVAAAQLARSSVCVIDPDDLWEPAWQD